MNRWQFYVLNLTSLLLVGLVGFQFWLAWDVQTLNNQVIQTQAVLQINNARKIAPMLQNVSERIAQASENEARFRDLLVKHGMKVTLKVNGQQKNYP